MTAVRRFNYTRRERIKHEHVTITLRTAEPPDLPSFEAQIDLTPYRELPSRARVFVEATRQTAWQRFDFGTVANPKPAGDLRLIDFGTGEGVRFRVKVVQADAGARAALLLAHADGIEPNADGPARSLLPIEPDPNLTEEAWALDLDTESDDGPRIRVSTPLVPDRRSFARSPAFMTLVLPDVLRRTLHWALERDQPESDDDWNAPPGRWIRLGCAYLGQKSPPEGIFEKEGDDREVWVESVVNKFCSKQKFPRVFGDWWSGEAERGRAT